MLVRFSLAQSINASGIISAQSTSLSYWVYLGKLPKLVEVKEEWSEGQNNYNIDAHGLPRTGIFTAIGTRDFAFRLYRIFIVNIHSSKLSPSSSSLFLFLFALSPPLQTDPWYFAPRISQVVTDSKILGHIRCC